MKNYLFLFILLVTGQLAFSQGTRFSFTANPQLTWFAGNGDDYESNGVFLGLNTGLEADFFFSENYAFSLGLNLNNVKGGVVFSDSTTFTAGDTEKVLPAGSRMTHTLQYISFPAGLKFKTVEIGYSTYWLNTGVTPMLRIKSRVTDESEVFEKTDFKDETSLFNMNYFIELGLEYSLGGNTALIGGLGYYSGFMDVTNSSSEKLTTKSFAIILGVVF
jgi:hypothetical protein